MPVGMQRRSIGMLDSPDHRGLRSSGEMRAGGVTGLGPSTNAAMCLALAVLTICGPAKAARATPPIPCARIAGGGGEVAELTGTFAFTLKDGTQVSLLDVGLPGKGTGPTPAADAAREAMKTLVLGKSVRLYYEAKPALREDRHGRRLVQVLVGAPGASDAFWLQARLIEMGAALIDSWHTNRACVSSLLPLEVSAREGERGLWTDAANRPIAAERAGAARGVFALIEGTIVRARKIGGTIYLDFSDDWRRGLAVTVGGKAARLFAKAGVDPLKLAGRRVRVRGYVNWGSGPEIAATHPEMLEFLPESR